MTDERLVRLRHFLREQQSDAVIVEKPANVRYFSGFSGDDSLLLVSSDKAALVTDSRYLEQAGREAPMFEIVEQKEGLISRAADFIRDSGWRRTAFEGGAMLFDTHSRLVELLGEAAPAKSLNLDKLREIKDATEISCIEKAASIGDQAFGAILKFIRPGVSEIEVAARLEFLMRSLGSERPAFPTIVASGVRGSLPHGIATEKLIASGEFVTMDFGAVYRGYCSDMTRTVAIGRVSDELKSIYEAVKDAQAFGISGARPGRSGKEVDAEARQRLGDLAKYFGHGLGHSLGLEIHEEPRLSPRSKCESLEPFMIVTVEPGVYIEGVGGVRIEDTVLVTKNGGLPLTKSGKELIEII